MEKYYFGTGRRKTSIAQVRLSRGSGKVMDSKGVKIQNEKFISEITKPLGLFSKEAEFDITIKKSGGGFSSQTGATQLAVARALSKLDEESEKTLKKEGFLTRDSREKERKKPGLRRARRAPQWAKR
jgi:small subunit ribosomal protein S9